MELNEKEINIKTNFLREKIRGIKNFEELCKIQNKSIIELYEKNKFEKKSNNQNQENLNLEKIIPENSFGLR